MPGARCGVGEPVRAWLNTASTAPATARPDEERGDDDHGVLQAHHAGDLAAGRAHQAQDANSPERSIVVITRVFTTEIEVKAVTTSRSR
ncbi:hypothetical protein SRIMM317S_03804 [Streptomyces rimosus subsp. rimosus]